jgi:hypothetical protein
MPSSQVRTGLYTVGLRACIRFPSSPLYNQSRYKQAPCKKRRGMGLFWGVWSDSNRTVNEILLVLALHLPMLICSKDGSYYS